MSTAKHLPVIGVGASAGGVEALQQFFQALPRQLPAALMVVLHVPPHSGSRLDAIIAGATSLPVLRARDGDRIQSGHVYVAVPDRHLMLEGDHVRLSRGPKECRMRPAVDVLFRSLAVSCGARAAGVVLSGMLDDGTAGLWAIKEHKGFALAQEPAEALYPSMPESARDHVALDHVGPVAQLAAELLRWSQSAKDADAAGPDGQQPHAVETRIAAEANALREGVMQLGRQSRYTCPDCHGVLVEIQEGKVVRFRCHTGHAFSIKTLLAEVDTAVDNGLWDSIRAMEERLLLLLQLSELATDSGDPATAERYRARARELDEPIQDLRKLVLDGRLFGHESER
ncbi:MAG: CheB methylesterase [Ramlibacter sp.]|jgi:two-component system chemotaxis response regulator CheB|nr:CheB methylesterase [Ramlibacter sp.]MDB5915595.1 CheB methylesterase [Ramlibacter sp.]